MDANTGTFNVANSEVVIKVIGNGNQKQSSTKVTLTHTDKDAKLRLVKLADSGTDSYDNVLSGLTSSISDVIASTGNYYIVSADKAGTLTIKVDSKVKDAKDNDVAITATHTVMFKAIDITKPVVEGSDVVASKGSITAMIKDANLNTKTTKVIIKDINGKVVKQAVYTDGKYVASGLTSGLYQVWIFAADMAGNKQEFNFTRTVGKGAATVEETAAITLIAQSKYTVAGTFSSYDFKDVDSKKDWIYTKNDGTVYQLLGEAPTDTNAFGWKEVKDVKATDTNVWYMVKTGKGKFDWALVNKDGLAFQLSGANEDGTFKFSGRLYLNAKYSDNTLTFTAK